MRAVVCTAAAVALLGPVGAVAHADDGPEEPLVERIALTDDAGAPTAAGESGLDDGAPSALSTDGASSTSEVDGAAGADVADAADDLRLLTLPVETEEFYVAALTWSADSVVTEDLGFLVRVLEPAGWSDWSELNVEDGAESDSAVMGSDPFVASGATAVQVQVRGDVELPADLTLALIPDHAAGDAPVQTDVPQVATVDPTPSLEPVDPQPEQTEVVDPEPSSTGEQDGAESEAAPSDPTDDTATDPADAPASDPATDGGSTDDATSTAPSDSTTDGTAEVADDAGATSSGTPGSRSVMTTVPAPTQRGAAVTDGVVSPLSMPILGNPGVRTRAQWGADERIMTWNPRRVDLRAAVVHHTAGSNTYTQAQVPAVIRSIYHYHAITREWGDIGYNVLVDRFGQAWEGRAGTLSSPVGQMVIGGHARPMNTHTLGISVMGTYTQMRASSSVMNTMADVLAWQFARAGLSMDSGSGLISSGTGSTPSGREMPRIFGHQAVSLTACPGQIQGQLGDLTRMVRERQPLMNYLNNRWTGTADIQFRYGERNAQTFSGDWDGDGRDTLATRVGNLISIRNSNSYGAPDRTLNYGKPGDELLVGDWNGDGTDTFAVRRGNAYHIRNSLTSGRADVVLYYGRAGDEVYVGDWNGDGRDTLAVRRGQTFYLRNDLNPGPATRVFTYGRASDQVVVGDWDGDGLDTFTIRRGAVYHVSNSLRAGAADRVLRYGREGDVVVVGDWNRDGSDTLGVVRRP